MRPINSSYDMTCASDETAATCDDGAGYVITAESYDSIVEDEAPACEICFDYGCDRCQPIDDITHITLRLLPGATICDLIHALSDVAKALGEGDRPRHCHGERGEPTVAVSYTA